MKKAKNGQSKSVILISNDFEEETAIFCLARLRKAGIPVELVSLAAGIVTGQRGLRVRPDCSLNDLESAATLEKVIVPGSDQSATTLMADPRVHRLLTNVIENGGRVAIAAGAEAAFARAGQIDLMTNDQCLLQGSTEMGLFVDSLIDMIESG